MKKTTEQVKKEIMNVCIKEALHIPNFIEFEYDDKDNVESLHVYGVPYEEKYDVRSALLTHFQNSRFSTELIHIVGYDGLTIAL